MKNIGFWYGGPGNKKYPRISSCVDKSFSPHEKKLVIKYLTDDGVVTRRGFKGWSTCRVCKCHNGSSECSDGEYIWPSGYSHYIKAHGVKPPQAFIRKVLRYYNKKRR